MHSFAATRLLRALTALVTVWCLGCSSFEPLLGRLLGQAGVVMSCGSDQGMSAASASVHDSNGTPAVSASADHGERCLECGCQSCSAPAPTVMALTTPPRAWPMAHPATPAISLDSAREPLVPPPEVTL